MDSIAIAFVFHANAVAPYLLRSQPSTSKTKGKRTALKSFIDEAKNNIREVQ
jgi:hypothetical protein